MARSILLLLAALAMLPGAFARAQEGGATGELVRSGDVPEEETNGLREQPPAEIVEGRLSDDDAPSEPAAPYEPPTSAPYDPPTTYQPRPTFQPRPTSQPPTTYEPPATFSLSSDDAEPLEAQPATKSGTGKLRPLAARGRNSKQSPLTSSLSNPTESLITMGGSLCVVLTLFFGLAWLTRRGLPKGHGKLPAEVIEVLGKAPLVKGQELQLVRVGAKLVLICVTPNGCETLTEIVDRTEVDRLATICRTNGPASMTAAFNQVLTGVGREPATGFAGSARTSSDRRGGRTHA